MYDKNTLAKRIKKLRLENGLTQLLDSWQKWQIQRRHLFQHTKKGKKRPRLRCYAISQTLLKHLLIGCAETLNPKAIIHLWML